jgi:transcriptional regulator with XRE-family HTH domain
MTQQSAASPDELTAKHVRAARALLAWSQQDLAKAASVATSTVADFERGQRTPVANNSQAIRSSLEGAGIQFLPTGAIIGPPIPGIRPSGRSGMPVRWVSAEDLSDWANRNDGAQSLPRLVAHLARATHGPFSRLRFPSDEGVRHAGWDGLTSTDVATQYVPSGDAGWEIGTQRNDISGKASDDYDKRSREPSPLVPAEAAFIFVTPRHWPKKDEWAQRCQKKGLWREVRAYDANDLVHWIEQAPAVGLWLARRLGKRPPETLELEEVWEEWSMATQWPLTQDLVLSDRDQDAAEVLRWLRGEPSVLSLQSTTSDEVIAFFHAVLCELPDDLQLAYRARVLVATAGAARHLVAAQAPLIIILTDPEPGLAQRLADRGHYVLHAYDERPMARGGARTLARPSREGLAVSLVAMGLDEAKAAALARDSARNLAVLRRLIPAAPGRSPDWANGSPPRALIAALLAGGWDDESAGDRDRLGDIAGEPYEATIAALAPFVGKIDSPLQKIGTTWRISSPADAWFLLAGHLTSIDLTRFEAAADEVLGATDPRFALEPDQRWMAGVRGVHPHYSPGLRHGVGRTLILLAIWGDRALAVPNADRHADSIVGKLLRHATKERWWSLSRDFRLLAEAAPDAFLTAVEDSLDQPEPPISVLFGQDSGGVFETEYLSDLMWALETLAWSPDLVPRVTHLLARLDAIDTKPRRYTNGPGESLRSLHRLWIPQTYANLDERLRALDLIRKRESNASWKLMLAILPSGHDVASPSPKPQWRDFTLDQPETVTWALVRRGATMISERLVADVGRDPVRWSALLDRLGDLAPDPKAALDALDAAEPTLTDSADRAMLRDKLRRVLHHHREFDDAEWALPADVLDRLDAVYERLAPSDPIKRLAWLFEQHVVLPKSASDGWEAKQQEIDTARKEAAALIYAEGGISAVLALSRQTETGGFVGKALNDGGLSGAEFDDLLETALRSENARERDLGHGLIVSAFGELKESWAAALIAKATSEHWGDIAVVAILRALPIAKWTWDQASAIGGNVEVAYWRQMPVYWLDSDKDAAHAARKLLEVGRARHALALGGRSSKAELPSDLLVDLLRAAAQQPLLECERVEGNDAIMFQHNVAEILSMLDDRGHVDKSILIELEWNYLHILEHSRRPAKILVEALADEPSLFIQMLSAAFKPSEKSGIIEPDPADPQQARTVATQAYRLLELWDRIPGTRADGSIDGERLERWIKEARKLAEDVGRSGIADDRIGAMLSASPMGADGNWPAEAVRDAIDLFRSSAMSEGFQSGKANRRGVTMRMPRDGGLLERAEAANYRAWSKALAYDHPHTAKALNTMAESYEWQARRHDEDAERLDWQD